MTLLLVALGAAVGAPARYAVSLYLPGRRATLLVNVLGSLLLGAVAHRSASTTALVGTGFCGAFTTYSAFAVEAVSGSRTQSWRYVVSTVLLCVGAAAVGRALV